MSQIKAKYILFLPKKKKKMVRGNKANYKLTAFSFIFA